MNANTSERRKRDWAIIIFILPLGLAMMLCVGQMAVRMSPSWSVSGEMNSSLDPEAAPKQNALVVPPISSDILTPMSWWDTFLTPSGGGVVFPPFITFEPSLTPTPTETPSATPASPTVSPTSSVTTTPTPPTSTPTKKPDDNNNTPTPPPTTVTVSATPALCTDPNATNNGLPAPCTYPIPVSSTPEGSLITPVPTQINVGTPDGGIGNINDGQYIVITLSATPIVVNGISDTNYDFVYYEQAQSCTVGPTCPSGSGIQMDSVIISISMDDTIYYVVFNWGDGTPDNNSNVGDVTTNTGTENDNQIIDSSELHGTAPEDTGILIDVDNAPSNPPPGDYWYVAIQAPTPVPTSDGGVGFDSIEVAENTPTP